MCCRCHLQPGTGGRIDQSPWTSGVQGAAATSSRARERRKGKTVDGGGGEKRAEETGVSRREDGRQTQQPVGSQDTNEGGNQPESTPEVSATLTAAQEAYRKASSHASGEAWKSQVRP
ncbi:hypothetical protein NDU88_003083 [Pleurodeles waltl]|uniref:Uncharacterized protein n=1 Tax=Pleurodeles waltl TaxID=8319 RepID=A0AAV7SEK0_PLEWA|nr:hypothetical protein NDU88_003083 [Pleurodeles waltl]